ncbi:MAG: heliorhodopsin HeR [Acidimicrobiia bacterium]|nr:heliorhodopsin HeR [Acidimicrobiia bacterium]
MTTVLSARASRLRTYNLVMGGLHAIQGIVVLLMANAFALPVTAVFLEGQPGAGIDTGVTTLFEIRVAWGVAAFLFLSAIAHFVIVSPGVYDWYLRNLSKNRNYARWIEYSLSSSLMVVLIAQLTGIYDVAALGAIFGVNAMMILFGLLQEHYEEPGSGRWMPYWFGVLAGIVPWLLIGLYLWSPSTSESPPAFVFAIFISLFVFFNTFAVNQVLQYRKVGKWADYVYGEVVYIFLSLTAKSLLAWQIFGSTLQL